MIHYALRCGAGHEFDGWFNCSASFDTQAAGGLLDCPICADTSIERAIMSPRLNKGAVAKPEVVVAPAPAQPSATSSEVGQTGPVASAAPPKAGPPQSPRMAAMAMPDQVRAVLQRIRTEVEKSCEYVGPDFAETARQIHAGAAPRRPIYGEATQDEAAALAEDGIDVASVPWVPRADS
jgi:hypothetical protein